ncbi:hypothetical protein GNY06_07540 [Elizabethkingia argentiflava]|uniref:DUF6759 domain-containing protein n=1 Tax=Elizabethkingia argenteiflava TaxID=2681556 RepID=A0A845PTU0_9FLAO|nr:DUF6759 domain-containing protein [Elizabethkingia argenteiflava]NAW51234.1 hypothetical protein [Elizabethkingia argenteiflava]
MKKNLTIMIGVFLLWSCASRVPRSHILNTNDIKELEAYIKKYPKDKDILFLKQKYLALKVAAQPKVAAEVPMPKVQTFIDEEAEEFAKLMEHDRRVHNDKTVKILNQIFNNDISDTNAILLVHNTSDCNMILRIQGEKFYNLAIPAHGENSLVLKQGEYDLKGSMCGVIYNSRKVIKKNLSLGLGVQ